VGFVEQCFHVPNDTPTALANTFRGKLNDRTPTSGIKR